MFSMRVTSDDIQREQYVSDCEMLRAALPLCSSNAVIRVA